MAHLGALRHDLEERLQNAVGLEGRDLSSLKVSLHIGDNEVVLTEVKFVEFIDEKQQTEITLVHEWMAKQEVP